MITPLLSVNDLFLLITISVSEERERSFNAIDLNASYETIRSISANFRFKRQKEAFNAMKTIQKNRSFAFSEITCTEPDDNFTSKPNLSRSNSLPKDIVAAFPEIRKLLKIASTATGSSSATFRLLNKASYKLFRVLSAHDKAEDQMNAEKGSDEIHVESQAITATVAREGIEIYEPNLGKPIREDLVPIKVPGRFTLSEYCMPVYLSGLVVGVLNFEHQAENAYDQWENLFELIASGVSQALESSARNNDVNLLNSIPTVWELEHTRKHAGQFISYLDKNYIKPCKIEFATNEERSAFETKLADLRKETDEPRTKKASDPNLDVITVLNQCFQGDIFTLDLADGLDSQLAQELSNMEIEQPVIRALETVGSITSRNISDHSKWSKTTFSLNLLIIGGKTLVQFAIDSKLDPGFVSFPEDMIYRLPIKGRKQKMHLGCFIAGRVMREAGGDIEARYINLDELTNSHGEDGIVFRTIIYVPVTTDRY
jgi:hypothetical protein